MGHGTTASGLLAAARRIVPDLLDEIVAIDAGVGETPALSRRLCANLEQVDRGRGVLVITDLVGASPWGCAQREAQGHETAVVSGLNLAMLLKLATLNRRELTPLQLAHEIARGAHRSVTIDGATTSTAGKDEEEQ